MSYTVAIREEKSWVIQVDAPDVDDAILRAYQRRNNPATQVNVVSRVAVLPAQGDVDRDETVRQLSICDAECWHEAVKEKEYAG